MNSKTFSLKFSFKHNQSLQDLCPFKPLPTNVFPVLSMRRKRFLLALWRKVS
jgi:hypothetical protein